MSVLSRILTKSLGRRTLSAVFVSKCYSVDNGVMKSLYPEVDIPRIHVIDFVMNDIEKWHDKIALECGITGRRYTYDDFRLKSRRLSKAFRKKLKLQRRDVVAILLPNIPEFPICMFGALLAGLKLTTINPTYTAEEIKRQLEDSGAKVLVTLIESWDNAKNAINLLNKKLPIVVIKTEATESIPYGAINFQELIDAKIDLPDVELSDLDETIFIPYSSGTTGLPKGVEISSQNLVSNIIQLSAPNFKFYHDATETHQDVLPAVLPMFHIYGFTFTTLAFLKSGGRLVTLPKFTPDSYIDTIIKHKPQILTVVPPIVIYLNTHPAVKTEHLQCLRGIMCGAAPLGALDEEKFRKKVEHPVQVFQGYGLSETSPVVTIIPIEKEGKYPGSMGTPIPNTLVKVVNIDDPESNHLGPNKTGELLVKGPQVMRGYYNKPEQTSDAFTDGWFRTGDIVYYNEDNMFYIADRIKELIKVKGFQVAPAELEEIIRDYAGVADAAVIGIPHEYSGELPRAYVVQKAGATINAEKLQEFVESKVAPHKKLKGGVVILESIPKSASGKILRRALKLQYEEKGI